MEAALRAAGTAVKIMRIYVNGAEKEVAGEPTIADLLAQLGLPPARVAVELNHALSPRQEWNSRRLAEGDRLEVVQFVGGGA